jgi:hypothetical protein
VKTAALLRAPKIKLGHFRVSASPEDDCQAPLYSAAVGILCVFRHLVVCSLSFHGLVSMNIMGTDKLFLLDSLSAMEAALDAGARSKKSVELELAEQSGSVISAFAELTMEHV